MFRMECTAKELAEAKRQIDSTLHKLRKAVRTLRTKENPERRRPQITLAERRIKALEIANALIDKEIHRFREAEQEGIRGQAERSPRTEE